MGEVHRKRHRSRGAGELEALARAFGLSVAELFLPDVRTRNGEEGR